MLVPEVVSHQYEKLRISEVVYGPNSGFASQRCRWENRRFGGNSFNRRRA